MRRVCKRTRRGLGVRTSCGCAGLLAAAVAASVQAGDRYWVAGSGFWNDGSAWSTTAGGAGGAGMPGVGDNAYVLTSTSVLVTRDNIAPAYAAPGLALLRVDGATSTAVPEVDLGATSHQLTANFEEIGYANHGNCVQFGSTNSAQFLLLGFNGGVGQYTLNDGTIICTNLGVVGGTLTQNGGTITDTQTAIGSSTGAALFTHAGGTLTAGTMNLGGSGGEFGTFSQSTGTMTFAGLSVFAHSRFLSTAGSVTANGPLTVDGGTFSVTNTINMPSPMVVQNSGFATIVGNGLISSSSISVLDGATLSTALDINLLTPASSLTITDSKVSATTIELSGGGTVFFNSGTLALTGTSGLVVASGAALGKAIDLPVSKSLEISGTTNIGTLSSVTLDGGTFSTGALSGNGAVVFNSGTFRLTASDLLVGAGSPFTSTFQILPLMHVEITGAHIANVAAGGMLYMGGGSLNAAGGITNNGEITLASAATRLSGGILTNNGTLDGTGRIDNNVVNNPSGTMRAGPADHLLMTGPTNISSGTIQILGGIVEAQQSMENDGTITGRGSLIVSGGLNNTATITFDSGPSDVFGEVTNGGTSRVLVTGGGSVTFHDTVGNKPGSRFQVSAASVAAFLSPVAGLAAFTGSGTTIFESTTSPGPLAAGTSVVETTGNLSVTSIRQPALIVRGNASIAPDGSSAATSVLQSLSIDGGINAWTGVLDVGNNHLIVDYSGSSPMATIANEIKTGATGNWTGNGINSSTAHTVAINAANPHKTGLGYAEASTLGVGSFGGQTVDSTSLLIGYTYLGDSNLDGRVNALDFNALATGYGAPNPLWSGGDFNYDGLVNTADFTLLAGNFGQVLSAPALGSIVPEPTALLIVAAVVGRRRDRFIKR